MTREISRVRLLNIDTGKVRSAILAYAYSMERMANREVIIGEKQTHVFVECVKTGATVCVSLAAYEACPQAFRHPADNDMRRIMQQIRRSAGDPEWWRPPQGVAV